VTVSAISHVAGNLEALFGIRLPNRTTRSMSLTGRDAAIAALAGVRRYRLGARRVEPVSRHTVRQSTDQHPARSSRSYWHP